MNLPQNPQSDFPFITDKNHIYNQLVDNNFHYVDLGWAKFEFELNYNLKFEQKGVDGLTLFEENKIKLEMDLDDEEARETIFHEIVHCALETAGLDERNFNGEHMTITNEFLVCCLSKQMRVINNLNPGLLGLIFG